MPKGRYKIMARYMDKKGKLGRDMMFRTSTVQVNLDFSLRSRHGAEAARRRSRSSRSRPRSSPILRSRTESPTAIKCFRSDVWLDTDPDRTGHAAFRLRAGHGL